MALSTNGIKTFVQGLHRRSVARLRPLPLLQPRTAEQLRQTNEAKRSDLLWSIVLGAVLQVLRIVAESRGFLVRHDSGKIADAPVFAALILVMAGYFTVGTWVHRARRRKSSDR